ncbi:hypothetical protein SERLADRAFT_472374 [Serpula lacrymans var. lacrymans S7.9]|uniref:Uncharacterized protein n=1 Tax=Serpula lacrymans var. lacrymans (strain S7.9) TaxID=578457 RepID=F8P3G9_SERL9|nr:uncharacterized protein SERLADRAFT_472374 [Serpula lacrymans var. lacrymans S7.9]EGO22069.1 hypothetical protein SERLADRAFT_472374 [Serpula lacrymans var. lacrymans S7.9]
MVRAMERPGIQGMRDVVDQLKSQVHTKYELGYTRRISRDSCNYCMHLVPSLLNIYHK